MIAEFSSPESPLALVRAATRLTREQYAALVPIPMAQYAAFHGLPIPAQQIVQRWRPIIGELRHYVAEHGSTGIRKAFERVAREHSTKDKSVAYGQVRKLYYAVKDRMELPGEKGGGTGNGWRALLDSRFIGKGAAALNPEFLEYWHGKVGDHQRNTARAFREFREEYLGGVSIPGLPPAAERTANLPPGLSEATLTRPCNMPSDAAKALARQGFAAMKRELPTGPMDISEVRPLEYIVCDDVEVDFLMSIAGIRKPVKLRLIVMMDLCSRMILSIIVRPGIERPDGTEDGLKLTDMKAAIAHLLRTWGVPANYPMTLVCERGTAAVPDADKAALAEMSDGRILVSDTSMIVGRVFEWGDRARGNSWGKAWLESSFNLLHNELQALRGQKGLSYERRPAELHGRALALRDVEWLAERLPGAHFKRPFVNIAEARHAILDALARMHARQDHSLLYFSEVQMWRAHRDDALKPEWELPENLRPVAGTLEWVPMMESPKMRFIRLLPEAGDLIAIPESALQRMMDTRRRERWDGHAFTFDADRTKFTCVPSEAMKVSMVPKRHYILWFHPQQMEHIYVTRDPADGGGYVGMVRRYTAGKYGEVEDAERYLAEQKRIQKTVVLGVKQAGIGRIRAAADELRENSLAAIEEIERAQSGEMVVTAPEASGGGTARAAGLLVMTAAVETHEREAKRLRMVDVVAQTLARTPRDRSDAGDQYA